MRKAAAEIDGFLSTEVSSAAVTSNNSPPDIASPLGLDLNKTFSFADADDPGSDIPILIPLLKPAK